MIDCILHGDSFDLAKDIPDHSIDLILEDMPYNTTACEWDVKIDLELYWETRLRILKPTGAIVLTASQPFTSELVMSNRKMFKYEMSWIKNRGTGHLNAKIMPLVAHENILVFCKGKTFYNPQKWKDKPYQRVKCARQATNKGVYGKMDKTTNGISDGERYPLSVVEFDKVERTIHPTEKPVDLFEYLIRTYTNEGDLVFDGFGGSGTTAIAASKCNRHFIVIEKEKKYFDASQKRLTEFRSQLKLAI